MNTRALLYIILLSVLIILFFTSLQKNKKSDDLKRTNSRNRMYVVLYISLLALLAIILPRLNQKIESLKKNR